MPVFILRFFARWCGSKDRHNRGVEHIAVVGEFHAAFVFIRFIMCVLYGDCVQSFAGDFGGEQGQVKSACVVTSMQW